MTPNRRWHALRQIFDQASVPYIDSSVYECTPVYCSTAVYIRDRLERMNMDNCPSQLCDVHLGGRCSDPGG